MEGRPDIGGRQDLRRRQEEISKQARKNMKKATDAAGSMKGSAQRQVRKTVFRTGLVTGLLLALLFTPIAGSEIRKQIASKWEEYRTYFGF